MEDNAGDGTAAVPRMGAGPHVLLWGALPVRHARLLDIAKQDMLLPLFTFASVYFLHKKGFEGWQDIWVGSSATWAAPSVMCTAARAMN